MTAARAAGILALALAGCSDDVTNSEFDGLVQVSADVQPGDDTAVVTIRNESSGSILLDQFCGIWLEYRDGGEWQQNLVADCLAGLGYLSIEPGDELVVEQAFGSFYTESGDPLVVGSPPRLRPGEYRFTATLTDTDGNPLPGDVRTSNTFRIDP